MREAKDILEERRKEYKALAAHDSKQEGYFVVRCPDCGSWMHLGPGWRSCSIPNCPECNGSADEWADDPVISENYAEHVKSEERNLDALLEP